MMGLLITAEEPEGCLYAETQKREWFDNTVQFGSVTMDDFVKSICNN